MAHLIGVARPLKRPPSAFAVNHAPAVSLQATITRAAAGSGFRNVCTGLTVVMVASTAAPTLDVVTARVIDGSSGGSTILWQAYLGVQLIEGDRAGVALANLWIEGSDNTAMTLEFSAGVTNVFQSVALEGHVVAS